MKNNPLTVTVKIGGQIHDLTHTAALALCEDIARQLQKSQHHSGLMNTPGGQTGQRFATDASSKKGFVEITDC